MLNIAEQEERKRAWKKERAGMFTASECHKLFSGGRGTPKALFGDGAMTYIEIKVDECLNDEPWENPKVAGVNSLEFGKAHEEIGVRYYMQETGIPKVRHFGVDDPFFMPYPGKELHAGGSPDGLCPGPEGWARGLEMKVPWNPNIHTANLLMNDQWDLKEKHPLYYAQVQMLLAIFKAPVWDWVSFDSRKKLDHLKMKIIPVYPDRNFQDELDMRLDAAIKIKTEMLDCLINRKPFRPKKAA